MRNKNLIFILTSLIILSWSSQSFPLAKETHQAINEEIAQRTINGFSLNNYLKNNLGFENGVEEVLTDGKNVSKEAFHWLGYGGFQEDIPLWRSFRHFHNSLEPWDSAGLKGSTLGRSSIIWAQSLDQSYGNYSWQDVRNYFYLALTSLDKTTRERYFAETFRGLGQLMHLVEDASVPMHARDDIHIFYSYESWVENFRNRNRNAFDNWFANAIAYDNSILNLSPNPLAPIPIARIIDTDSYDGMNPDITSGLNIGISEYTNANFFSDDTINSSNFPSPQTQGMPIVQRDFTNTLWNTTYPRQYYLKNCCGETNDGQGYLLSAVDYLDYYRQQYPLLSSFLPIIPVLDNNVYEDYASLLIPRAVGYSAGLLNYFFRGEINIIQLRTDTFQIINLSKEDMEGTFELYYDNTNDERILLWSDSLALGTLSSGNNKSSNINVDFSGVTNAKNPGEYMLVFKGKLGNEGVAPYDTQYAVVAQKITPHFLTHVEVNGQWDIYEYDLLGNRIYNVTGELPRGIDYYDGIPNPVNPDLLMYLSDSGCTEGGNCLHLLMKSAGQVDNLNRSGIFWWSKDGQKIYKHEGYYDEFYMYDISTDTWNSTSSYSCGYWINYSSFSPDESKLVSEGMYYSPLTGQWDIYDVLILTKSTNWWEISHVIDMNTMSLISVDLQTCQAYRSDEKIIDAVPDFHPTDDKIIFTSEVKGTSTYNIYLVDIAVGTVQELTNASLGEKGYFEATWSPDGQMILMAGEDPSEIFLMLSSGGTPTKITDEKINHYFPRWIRYLGQ